MDDDSAEDMTLTLCMPYLDWGITRLVYPEEYARAPQVSEGAATADVCPFDDGMWHLMKRFHDGPQTFSESGPWVSFLAMLGL